MTRPLGAANSRTTEHLLELALAMLDDARREQNTIQLPANNWLTNNFTLEIIRAKVRNQTCIDRDALTEILDRFLTLGDDVIYSLAGLVCCHFLIISNTCSRRSIWPCAFSRCVKNGYVSSGISAALAILGSVRKSHLFRAVNILNCARTGPSGFSPPWESLLICNEV